MPNTPRRHSLADWLIFGNGLWLVGLALYLIFVRPALLPEDLRYIGVNPQTVAATATDLGHVFTVGCARACCYTSHVDAGLG